MVCWLERGGFFAVTLEGLLEGGWVMGILAWIVFGLIAGAVAKLIMPGRQGGGIIMTIVLGVAGALVGGFLGTHVFNFGSISGFDLRSMAIAVGGALVVLFVFGLLSRDRG